HRPARLRARQSRAHARPVLGAVGGARLGRALRRAFVDLLARHPRHHGKAVVGALSSLKKDSLGTWDTLAEFLRDARLRETGALSSLANALAASPDDQRELALGDGGPILFELAKDLRVLKGARLAATRCLFEA